MFYFPKHADTPFSMKKTILLPPISRINTWRRAFLLAPILLLLTFSNCATFKQNRWLTAHQKELSRLAGSKLSAEQKLDGLIQDYVRFLQEDLKFVDPVKGLKFVKKYHDQNRVSMEQILRESEKWQGNLGTLDNVALGVRTLQKPYIRNLIDLGPKFKRKYKQYAFALELSNKITGGLTKFSGKDLF